MSGARSECQLGLPAIIAQVRRQAQGIVRQIPLASIEVADIENDLWLALLQSDPEFPLNLEPAAIKRAIRNACKSTLRKACAELASQPARRELSVVMHIEAAREHESVEVVHDVGVVMAKLPWRMCRLALHLMDSSGSDAAKSWGISRAAVYGMIGRMRRHFRTAT